MRNSSINKTNARDVQFIYDYLILGSNCPVQYLLPLWVIEVWVDPLC